MRQLFLALVLLAIQAASTLQASNTEDRFFSGAPRNDDGRFTNIVGDIGHGTAGIRVPFMLRRLGTYFRDGDGAPEWVANDGAFLRENARHSIPTVTWIGHATLLVQVEHVTFLTDPNWSNRPTWISLVHSLLGTKR